MNTDEPIPGPDEAHEDNVFLEYLEAHPEWSETTRERQLYWLSQLQHSDRDWRNVSTAELRTFEQNLLWSVHQRGGLYSANTVYQAMRMLRGFFRWAVQTGRRDEDPMRGWILPRPRSTRPPLLGRAQALQLLNLPDLTRPTGQRDALLLELLYHEEFSLSECRRLRLNELRDEDLEPSTQAALRRYLADGRNQLTRRPSDYLLLSARGGPIVSNTGLQLRLNHYARQLGLELSARILCLSYRAHQESLYQRLLGF